MGKRHLLLSAFTLTLGIALHAQDIAGQWQGVMKSGSQDLRVIVQISKNDGGWSGTVYRVDEVAIPFALQSLTIAGSLVKFTAPRNNFEGKLSADGNLMSGSLTDEAPLPLDLHRATPETAWSTDVTKHTIQFVNVQKDVKLEVLDWGGSGRPLVLLTGLGDNAHMYDRFAPKLAATYHVYGITRRGFGASSVPASGYDADRLGDDVLVVLDALKIDKPVLVGHSIAGVELSSIGSRRPERVAGLVYLEAAYDWAFYDPTLGGFDVDLDDLQKKLTEMRESGYSVKLMRELMDTLMPRFQRDMLEEIKNQDALPPAVLESQYVPFSGPMAQILAGEKKFSRISAPALAIYAVPKDLAGPPMSDSERAKYDARDLETTTAQANAFERSVPGSRVVRLAHARHYVQRSNEADVLREIHAFISGLP